MRTPRYTELQVREAVRSSRCLTEALRRLGLRPAGGNHETLKRLIARFDIPTDHFDPNYSRRRANLQAAAPLDQVLVEDSTYSRDTLKRRLYSAGLKDRRCELCDQGEIWRGAAMSLILDHINGVASDNRLENLRIVCPNCAATLETHCGRKNRLEIEPRECPHCGGEFLPRFAAQRFCSQTCGVHGRRSRMSKPEARKVPRPSYEQLLIDLESTSYVGVGRKYGVSDNAVRKWVRRYESERELRHHRDQDSGADSEAA